MKKSSYAKLVPKLISNNVDNYDEIARWVLDRNRIGYLDQRHAPGLYIIPVNMATGLKGTFNQPALVTTDAIVNRATNVVDYYEARCPVAQRLYPEDPEENKTARDLVKSFEAGLMLYVTGYVYSIVLSHPKYSLPVFRKGIPTWEKVVFTTFYPIISKALGKAVGLNAEAEEKNLSKVREVFATVDDLLKDGRPFLAGNTFSAADIAFSSNASGVVMPPQFGGSGFGLEGAPERMRKVVEEMRATAAGQHILKMYAEQRVPEIRASELPKEPGLFAGWGRCLRDWAPSRNRLFKKLSQQSTSQPVTMMADGVCVNGYNLANDVLSKPDAFNQTRLSDLWQSLSLAVFPSYSEQQQAILKQVVKSEDAETIGKIVRRRAEDLTLLAKPFGQIDVVSNFAQVGSLMLVDDYLGVPSPAWTTMTTWATSLFEEVFAGSIPAQSVNPAVQKSAGEFKAYLDNVIAERLTGTGQKRDSDDDVLGRLLKFHGADNSPQVDARTVQQIIGGMIVSTVQPIFAAVTLAIDEFLRRPKALANAIAAAQSWDTTTVCAHVDEALRFNPPTQNILRYAKGTQAIGEGQGKSVTDGSPVIVAVSAAMFDANAISNPKDYDADRNIEYLSLRGTIDDGFGTAVLTTAITELVTVLLRLPGLRRCRTANGRLIYNGSVPNSLVVDFDS